MSDDTDTPLMIELDATANKSNSAMTAIDAALSDVRSGRTLPVPAALQDKHYAGAKRLGRGDDYQYAHDHPGNFVSFE